jgi:hypothetical protein
LKSLRLALDQAESVLEIEVGIAPYAVVGTGSWMGHGVVPDLAVVNFEDCRIEKQWDLVLAQVEG